MAAERFSRDRMEVVEVHDTVGWHSGSRVMTRTGLPPPWVSANQISPRCIRPVRPVLCGTPVDVVYPSGLSSPRGFFNYDWITLLVMVVIGLIGSVYFLVARPDRRVGQHVHDELEPTGAERHD